MMTLAHVENVLIRLQYIDTVQREVELLHIVMDSAAITDQGLGSASLVEECRCPAGYSGLSCEACAPGYTRQESGAWLGRCIRDEEPCRPGTYGDPYRKIPCKVNYQSKNLQFAFNSNSITNHILLLLRSHAHVHQRTVEITLPAPVTWVQTVNQFVTATVATPDVVANNVHKDLSATHYCRAVHVQPNSHQFHTVTHAEHFANIQTDVANVKNM